jgi:hypothetical protein
MRRLRFLVAIPAIAVLAIMGATGASAATVHQAAHARTVAATSSGADPWEFENLNQLFICSAGTHEALLMGCTGRGSVELYTIYPQSGAGAGYYVIKQGGFCWDSPDQSGDNIALESCPANDPDEWWAIPSSGSTAGILPYGDDDLCVWGAGAGNTVYLHTCAVSNRDAWESIYFASS